MALYCRRCGAEIPEGSNFCHICGTPVQPMPSYRRPPKRRKTIFQRAWFWILVSLCIAVIVIWPKSGQTSDREDFSSSQNSPSHEAYSESGRQEDSPVVRPPEESHFSMPPEESPVQASQSSEPNLSDVSEYVIPEEDYGYYGSLLSEDGKKAYAQFVTELDQLQTTLIFYQIDPSEIEKAFMAIHDDYPEFFWLTSGYQWESLTKGSQITVTFTVTSLASSEEIVSMRSAAVAVCQSLVDQTLEMSDYETALFFHDYIIETTAYDYDLAEELDSINTLETIAGNAYGALVEHKAICEGYARAFQWLMKERHLPCRLVKGYDINEYPGRIGHTWNIATLGGNDYHIDLTWDDPMFQDGLERLSHDYFCITTEELLETHIIRPPEDYPVCTATEYDYFRMNGYYVGSYDYEIVADALYIQTGGFYYLKFDSAEDCSEAIDILISDGVFRDMEGIWDAYMYYTSLNGRILTIQIIYE